MATKNTITFELKDGIMQAEMDTIMKKMLNSLSHEEISLIDEANLTLLIVSAEDKGERND